MKNVGVLTPEGKLIECEPYEHLDLAKELVEKMENVPADAKNNRLEAEVYLQKLGYIIVRTHDVYGMIGYIVDDDGHRIHMTQEQKKWLEDNYGDFSKEKRETVDDMFKWDK